ncbi:MAG: HpcH/HpaI aldolase/citrate lyase family protein [Huintestinicola sp.]|uniref:HpcH/HpaI aldolase/citrate lyase family protein n=1 Tax=Huintestinicola sp. TaxID=2981661 RepID=UPI003F1204D6
MELITDIDILTSQKNRRKLEYSVGPLLYMPALRSDIARKLSEGFPGLRSAAVCLEDTIRDDMVEAAEENLLSQLRILADDRPEKLPMIFIRVRSGEQLERLSRMPESSFEMITGFILPKIDDETFTEYVPYLNEAFEKKSSLYIMPIIENPSFLRLSSRYAKLERLFDELMKMRDRVLNVRIGGNDFCRALDLRADIHSTVYDILPVGQLISDIAAVFAGEFTVSAPVWNYFAGGDPDWEKGMVREMSIDRSIGLVGKTIIHPSQISVVNRAMAVPRRDYEDARLILENSGAVQVIKSADGGRMYENKVHSGWAEKILALAEVYGVTGD